MKTQEEQLIQAWNAREEISYSKGEGKTGTYLWKSEQSWSTEL